MVVPRSKPAGGGSLRGASGSGGAPSSPISGRSAWHAAIRSSTCPAVSGPVAADFGLFRVLAGMIECPPWQVMLVPDQSIIALRHLRRQPSLVGILPADTSTSG